MIRLLEWDSDFFGFPIARVEPAALASGDVDAWCRERGVRCAYLLLDANDHASMGEAAAQRFRAVDVRVVFTAAREARPSSVPVRHAVAADIPALRAIAATAHRDSRFYADGRFDRQRCDDLFALWIERSCEGWASQVFVIDHDGEAAGYVTVHDRGGRADVGLVGVHERARGMGAASAMLTACRRWCSERELAPVNVATQGGNRGALAVYTSAGFDVTQIHVWYHRWFAEP